MKYIITEAAYRDLDEIWFYTFQKWSESRADSYFEMIIHEIEIISEGPEHAKKISKIKDQYYYFRASSHYVFFKHGDKRIEIIRILHKMMDFSQHLE